MAGGEEDDATIRDDERRSFAESLADTRKDPRLEPLGPGTILDGKYEILKLLGAGGMGTVFSARHLTLRETVAIKVLQGDHVDDDDIKRFLREGRTAVTIKSEHAVRIFDLGQLPNGLPYLVMEHLDGEDLGRVLLARGPLPVDLVVACILQVCAVLEEAHGKGIVHRDIKPQNIFLLRGEPAAPKVKVLDFGLAKVISAALAEASLAGTIDGALLGSPHFMSPEQIRSARTVDHRTDVWALGATMYKLLTGQPPFVAPTVQRVLVDIIAAEPRPLREVRSDVSASLESVVMQCLTKSVGARLPSAAAVAAALRAPAATASSPPLEPRKQVTAPMMAVAPGRKKHNVQLLRASFVPPEPPAASPTGPPGPPKPDKPNG